MSVPRQLLPPLALVVSLPACVLEEAELSCLTTLRRRLEALDAIPIGQY